MSTDFRWRPVRKDPAETKPVELSLFGLCANFRENNEEYQSGDIVWPVIFVPEDESDPDSPLVPSGIGYCFECTQPGRSGSEQPTAFTQKTQTVDVALAKLDGSVEWTPRAPGSGGFSAVSDPQLYSVPDGISVVGLTINENMKLLADYAGGTDGEDYDVAFSFVIGGRLRIGRQTVQARLE